MAKKVKKTVKKAAPKKKAAVKKSAKKVVKKAVKKGSPKKKVVAKKKTAPKKANKKSIKKAAPKKKAVANKIVPKKKVAPAKKAVKKVTKKAAPVKNSLGINTYLTFPGNCEEAFNFYKNIFGGNFPYVGRFGEMPPMEGMTVPDSEKNKIMHMSLPIGANSILMGSDSSDAFGHATVIGNNFSISLNTTSQAEADKFYKALSMGGKQTMPMSKTFWGSYFGMLVDKFGINWMISFEMGKPM